MTYTISFHADAFHVERPGLFARLRKSLADYREYLATYNELRALGDSQLADIGLSRLNIREIARAACAG